MYSPATPENMISSRPPEKTDQGFRSPDYSFIPYIGIFFFYDYPLTIRLTELHIYASSAIAEAEEGVRLIIRSDIEP